jgi:alpha-glucosidase
VPDRFAIGDPTVGVRDGEFSYRGKSSQRRAWLEKPSADWSDAHLEFYGGDLKGIESKLDYLAELGTNAVYLTPVFTAFSSHRYDVVDYDHVDAHLGGDRALSSLRTAMATREMRLILDIVPNHCGVLHPWFQDAIADPAAPSAEFFRFIHYPDAYACWMGHRTLPKLDYRSGRLRDLMYRGANGIFRKWLRAPYSIDGWRVDVANMLARDGEVQLGTEVAREIRRAVKEENPSAYLLAEHFFDGTQTLQGDCWDGTMNYAGFTHPLWNWLMPWTIRQHDEPRLIRDGLAIGTTELLRTWESFRAAVPWTVASQQLNLLCSHDTPRIGTILQRNRSLETLAAGLLITYVGAPCLLYGTETGLLGEETGVLQCMPWDRSAWDMELFSLYRRLVGCRRSSRALREGGFQVLAADNDGFAFLRDTEDDLAIVVAHRGPAERPASVLQVMQGAVEDGTLFRELFTGTLRTVSEGHLTIPPSPPGIQIWLST